MKNNLDCDHKGANTFLFSATDYISGKNFPIQKCGACGLTVTGLSDEENPVFSTDFYPDDYYGEQNRYKFILGKVLDILVKRRAALLGSHASGNSGAVLDIGCGQGWFLKRFADQGWNAVGVEVSPSAAFHAREILDLDVYVGQTALESLDDDSFDVVCLWHVLEHVTEPKKILTDAARLIKSSGRLLLSVPNFGSAEARFGKANWFHLDVPRHVVHFTEESLFEMLEDTGWVLEKKSYFVPEYDFFSFIQTGQNLCGLETNLLYRLLRSGELKKHGKNKTSFWQKLLAVCSFPIFALASVIWVPIAIATNQGSSVNLVLNRKPC